ncbi:RNF213 [Mytilus edulis]|uniref:RNF213 n=1 Tax=Mytilus edulis TaxID=6550 RepID=A0A8S3RUR2_MYTED|nr:RNF213 [Mytilus edulis]
MGLTAVKYWIEEKRDEIDSRFETNFILEATKIVLEENTFYFDGNKYRQIKGTAMGTKVAPTYANLVMGYLEQQMYRQISVQMVSYQCSPLSVPEGIIGAFRQCAAYQMDKDLNRFVSVVVLDEVAFIGISNWALDPAKMNRGILVQREVPDITELIESADLIKMLYSFASRSKKKPSWSQLQHCILRNFGGLDNIKPVDIFCRQLIVDRNEQQKEDDPDNSPPGLIQACLIGDKISIEFGGERYVDLGLGTHRVKCRVHKKFRLIVVAEKQIVYDKFPIPLINRLEKHFLSLKTMLTQSQLQLTVKLQEWAQKFCEDKVPLHLRHFRTRKETKQIGEAFIDIMPMPVLPLFYMLVKAKSVLRKILLSWKKRYCTILDFSKDILLWCASPVAVLLREDKTIFVKYFIDQHHENLFDYLHFKIDDRKEPNLIVQVFFQQANTSDILLIVQCDSGDDSDNLLACARYTIQGELQHANDKTSAIHVVLLIQLPGIASGRFTGFQCGLWRSIHIDDIHSEDENIPSVAEMYAHSVGGLLKPVTVEALETSYLVEDKKVTLGNEVFSGDENEQNEAFSDVENNQNEAFSDVENDQNEVFSDDENDKNEVFSDDENERNKVFSDNIKDHNEMLNDDINNRNEAFVDDVNDENDPTELGRLDVITEEQQSIETMLQDLDRSDKLHMETDHNEAKREIVKDFCVLLAIRSEKNSATKGIESSRRPISFNTTLEDNNEQESSEMFTRFPSNAFLNAEKEHTVENSSIERQRRIIVEKPASIERPKRLS